MRRHAGGALVLGVVLLSGAVTAAVAAPTEEPTAEDTREPAAVDAGGAGYDRGVRARIVKDWTVAVEAFREVVTVRADFPDAWNELGFALRNLGRYPESLDAYGEALRLRPDFPEALEYLGEAYVKLGRLADARRILDRLRPLDTRRAQELADVIERAR